MSKMLLGGRKEKDQSDYWFFLNEDLNISMFTIIMHKLCDLTVSGSSHWNTNIENAKKNHEICFILLFQTEILDLQHHGTNESIPTVNNDTTN